MLINLGIYVACGLAGFLLAVGLEGLAGGVLLNLPQPLSAILDFFYIGFPSGVIGGLLLVLRMGIGGLFVRHGRPKLLNLQQWAKDIKMPVFLCLLSALSMFLGGCFLVVGWLTPLAALAILGSMVFAMFLEMSHGSPFVAQDPFQIPDGQYVGPNGQGEPPSYEKAFLYVLILSAIAILGPGAFSLDALLFG